MFKRYEVLLIICVVAILGLVLFQIGSKVIGCLAKGKSEATLEINFLPCENEEEVSGFIDARGCFCPFNYGNDKIMPVVNGYCVIDGTLYKVGNNPTDTIPVLRDIESYGIMNDGLMPMCRDNGCITIIDTEGKEVFQLNKLDSKDVLRCSSYSDSKLRVVLEDESSVYVDKKGQMLFDMRYSWATDFKNGYAVIQTTNQNEDLYTLIDNNAKPIFTFESEENEDIVVSHDMELLSAKQNKKIVIYDFSGKIVLECSNKVCGIYAFCKDGFVYYNDDDELGLMSYQGETLIKPRYKQFVPNGNYFLVRTGDDIIRLVDKKGTIQKEFDGENLLDFRHLGYDFPCVIETPDDFMIIDLDGNVIADGIDLEFNQDNIGEMAFIRSEFFPSDEIINTIMELCGDGNEVSPKYGAFFFHPNKHCSPKDITYTSSFSTNELIGKNSIRKNICSGINFDFDYGVVFNEPIVLTGETGLNPSAYLYRTELSVKVLDIIRSIAFRNNCIHEFRNRGCEVLYSKGGYYLIENKNLLYVVTFKEIDKNEIYELSVYMLPNNDFNRNYWQAYIEVASWSK